jgi:hypothetical protein
MTRESGNNQGVINGRPNNLAAALVQLGAIFGTAYCLIHVLVVNVIVAPRMRRRREALARGETPDEDLEDVVVYPDETSS